MLTELTKAQLLALRLGQLKDAGKVTPSQISLAKRNNVEAAIEIARSARDILGGVGILDQYQCFRHLVQSGECEDLRGNRRHASAHCWTGDYRNWSF